MQVLLTSVGAAPIVSAHILEGGGSAIMGFLHPLFGIDHLLAMLTVGLLSAMLGGRAIWMVPSTFVLTMVIGGLIGWFNVELPLVEYGIAASVFVLGVALLAMRRFPTTVAMGVVALFALFHGHAHGAELPRVSSDAVYVLAYILGFMTATAGLHVIGALTGYIALRHQHSAVMLRASGGLIALAGAFLVLQVAA